MGSLISKPEEPVAEPVAVSTAQEPVHDNGKQSTSGKRRRPDDDNDDEELRGHLTKKPRLDPDSVAQEQSENIPCQSEEKSGKRKRSEDDEEISAPPTKKSSPDPIEEDREISPVWSDLYPISTSEEDPEIRPVGSPLFPILPSEEDREISPPMSDYFEGRENPYGDDLYYIPVFEAGFEHNAYQEDVGDRNEAEDLYVPLDPPIIRTDSEGNEAWELGVGGWEEALNWNDDEDLYVTLDPPAIENNSEGDAARGRGVGEWIEAGNWNETGSRNPDQDSQNEHHNDNDSVHESEPSEGTLVADQEEQDTGPIQEMKDASIKRYAEGVDTIRALRLLTFDNPREAAQNEANIERERIRILAEKEWYEGLDAWDFEDELCDIVHKALRLSRCIENPRCQEGHHDPSDCKHKLKDELYAEISAACKKERKRPKYSFPRI
uniref:WGS project CBMI000000000 data, contig CS3069_c001298 n=1 Tax=Fusarium clavum TaxID=2594811 RepID=A0A090MBM1_9HYPO|nr:unnamed protein product [Fusarium clavum]